MRVIDLALKDLKQLVRDWKAAAFLIAMPIAFTLLFGFIFQGAGGEEDLRLPVGFLDQDDSVLSAQLLNLLGQSDAIRPVVLEGEDPIGMEDLEQQVEEGDLAAAVVVPAGYGERVLDGEEMSLPFVVDPASEAGVTAQAGVQTGVARLMGGVETAHLAAQILQDQGGSADRVFLEETLREAVAAWEEPPMTVRMTQSGAVTEEGEETKGVFDMENSYTHSSPGIMVQFTMAGLIGAAEILVLERKSKALRRLLTTAISRTGIILGHFLAMFVMVLAQILLLVGFGQFVLGVDYLREPLALLLMVVTIALWTASMGLLIGVVAKTEEQVIIFSLIPMLVLSGLGGAWMPLEYTSPTFQTVGYLTPTAWAMEGLQNLIVRGMGLSSVLLPAGILLAYAGVLFGLAVWRFRFE